MRRPPYWLDRYPAKMVASLAAKLVEQHVARGQVVLDPFAGSGAVLIAAAARGAEVIGSDVNPYATLLAKVKLVGFEAEAGRRVLENVLGSAYKNCAVLPMEWGNKDYWFTRATLRKLERLRGAAADLQLHDTPEGRSVLLSLALAARPCSRADQRSPKPFISAHARKVRGGRHFDPISIIRRTYESMVQHYAGPKDVSCQFFTSDARAGLAVPPDSIDVVITSPPYANAQDYFRNSLLELNLLSGLIPFEIDGIKGKFIGTERRVDSVPNADPLIRELRARSCVLRKLERLSEKHARIVYAYLVGIRDAFARVRTYLRPHGRLVVVCGDNRIRNLRIPTWQYLQDIIEGIGYTFEDMFGDPIRNRLLPPARAGHKGLIKEEKVMVFRA